MIHHVADRPYAHAALLGVVQVDEKHRQAVGLLVDVGERRRAREQQHQVGVLDARDPHLLAVDDVAVAASPAKVLSFVVSVPVVGSVTANDCRRSSPDAIFGR